MPRPEGKITREALVDHEDAALRQIRCQVVREMSAKIDRGENPIRMHDWAWGEYLTRSEANGLTPKGINFCLGNLDLLRCKHEPGFETLPDELGLLEGSEIFGDINETERRIVREMQKQDKNLFSYQYFAGIPQVRQAFAGHLAKTGIEISWQGTFFSDGGASKAASIAINALNDYFKSKGKSQRHFLAFVPGYQPIINMADAAGMKVTTCLTKAEDNFFPAAAEAQKAVRENNIDVTYLILGNNPTSTICAPDQLEEVLTATYQENKDMFYLVDLAYIYTMPQEPAEDLLARFEKAGVLQNTIFLTSLSKTYARPGSRLGAYHTLAYETLEPHFRKVAEAENPSPSASSMREAIGVLENVKMETVQKTSALYAQRRQTLIRSLEMINERTSMELFVGLGDLKADCGLYVYPELKAGMNSLRLFEESGVFGIGGQFFGEPKDSRRVRFAIGVPTTEEIATIPELFNPLKFEI